MLVKPRVSLLEYKFHDYEQVLEILAHRPAKITRSLNTVLFRSAQLTNTELTVLSPEVRERPHAGVTTVRLLEITRQWPRKHRSLNRFEYRSARIILSDSLIEFEKLDQERQRLVWESLMPSSYAHREQECAERAYLRLLNMTGFPVEPLNNFTRQNAELYLKRARESNDPLDLHDTLDLSPITAEFVQQVSKYFKGYRDLKTSRQPVTHGVSMNSFSPYYNQLLLMLRARYTEERLMSLVSRLELSDEVCPDEIIEILENWDEIKDYPVGWIKHMIELKHGS